MVEDYRGTREDHGSERKHRNPLEESEPGYLAAKQALAQSSVALDAERQALRTQGYTPEQVGRGIAPSLSRVKQLRDRVAWYERSFNGEFESADLNDCGRLLIALRLA